MINHLERLAQLWKDGALTDEEFAQQKAKLLADGPEAMPGEDGAAPVQVIPAEAPILAIHETAGAQSASGEVPAPEEATDIPDVPDAPDGSLPSADAPKAGKFAMPSLDGKRGMLLAGGASVGVLIAAFGIGFLLAGLAGAVPADEVHEEAALAETAHNAAPPPPAPPPPIVPPAAFLDACIADPFGNNLGRRVGNFADVAKAAGASVTWTPTAASERWQMTISGRVSHAGTGSDVASTFLLDGREDPSWSAGCSSMRKAVISQASAGDTVMQNEKEAVFAILKQTMDDTGLFRGAMMERVDVNASPDVPYLARCLVNGEGHGTDYRLMDLYATVRKSNISGHEWHRTGENYVLAFTANSPSKPPVYASLWFKAVDRPGQTNCEGHGDLVVYRFVINGETYTDTAAVQAFLTDIDPRYAKASAPTELAGAH